MKSLLSILSALLFSTLLAAEDGVLTSIGQVARLSKAQTIKQTDFDLTATVSSSLVNNERLSFLTLTDGKDHVILHVDKSIGDRHTQPGDTIRARGDVRWAKPNMPTVRCRELEVLGHGPPPAYRSAVIGEILSGAIDWELVRVTGLVRDILPSETNHNWTILLLCAEGETLYVSVYTEKPEDRPYDQLLGQTIEIGGFANPQTGSRRSYAGRFFHCTDPTQIRVHATTASPFDAPSIGALRNLEPRQIAAFGRTRAKGRVLARWRENEALIQTPTDQIIHIKTDGEPPPPRGSSIVVSGFPTSDLFNLTLSHALWRSIDDLPTNHSTVERSITAPQILSIQQDKPSFNAAQHGREVRLVAVVRDVPEDIRPKDTILVEDAGYTVAIDVSALEEEQCRIEPGSQIEVTGTCVLETDDWQPSRAFPQIRGFRIIVHDADGLLVLSRPSWWTAERLWTAITTLVAGLFAVVLWNIALRRAAARKGRELLAEQVGHLKAQMKTEERTRLAVELHDSLAQNLTGVSLEIDTAERVADSDPEGLKAHLGIASRTLKSCRDELRNCLWDLRNHALEESTMDNAIRQTLAPHVTNVELSIRFGLARERLTDNTAHAILTIVRELTLNAIRHGKATRIQVAGIAENGVLAVSVKDNGSGFDPESAPGVLQGHYGLLGVRERIDAFEGEFDIESRPGSGTKAAFRINLPENGKT